MHATNAALISDSRLHHRIPSSPSTSLPHRASPSSISFRCPSRRDFTIKASSASTSGAAVAEARSELSFYELLGIPVSGSEGEIRQAYRQLARKYHPDVSPPGQAEEYTQRFIQVQEAYETLSDPRRRAMYDRDMARGIHLAFSARRRYSCSDEDLDGRGDWRSQWQSQLSELKRRSATKDDRGDMSWGARMRQQRSESAMEC